MTSPTRYPTGVATSPPGYLFADMGMQTPAQFYQFFDDFAFYNANNWGVTGGGTCTSGATAALGGKLVQTTNNVDNDYQANYVTPASFAFQSGQDVWYALNFALSDPAGSTGSDFLAGMIDAWNDITPTDGVWFNKPQNSTTLSFKMTKAGTSTTVTVGTLAAATAYTVGFYYNGSAASPTMYVFSTIPYAAGTITKPSPYWPGGRLIALTATAGGTNLLTNMPLAATLLSPGFGIQAGTTAAQTNTVDYIFAGQTINRY